MPAALRPIAWHIGMVGSVMAFYLIYIALNQWTASLPAHDLTLWIDEATPLRSGWIIVYAGIFMAASLPGFVVRHPSLLKRTALAYVLVEAIAFVTFVLFPVHMTLRPEQIEVDSFTTWGVMLCYTLDKPTTCFPSLHVATSVLGALIVHKIDRTLGRPLLVLAVLISASTMLVKQHFFADVVAGLLLSGSVYWAVFGRFDLSQVPPNERCLPRWIAMGWIGVNLLALATMYGLYRSGWQAW